MNRFKEARDRKMLARQLDEQHRLDEARRAVPESAPFAPEAHHLAALRRIGSQLEALHKQSTTGDPALRALLVELAAQTSVIAELVAEMGRHARPQVAPITGLRITARDANDRIESIVITRGDHHEQH
jgi:hypothetical protein